MGATSRALVIALRTDATGVGPGFRELTQQSAAASAQLIKDAQAVADARAKLKEIQSAKPTGGSDAEMQAWKEVVDAQKQVIAGEMQMRKEHQQTFGTMQELDQQYLAMTSSQYEQQLLRAQLYYDRLAQKHSANAEAMEKIDRNYAVNLAKIQGVPYQEYGQRRDEYNRGAAGESAAAMHAEKYLAGLSPGDQNALRMAGGAEVLASERAAQQEQSRDASAKMQERLQAKQDQSDKEASIIEARQQRGEEWDRQHLREQEEAQGQIAAMYAQGNAEVLQSERAFEEEKTKILRDGLTKRLQTEQNDSEKAQEFDRMFSQAGAENDEAMKRYRLASFAQRMRDTGQVDYASSGSMGEGWMKRMAGMDIAKNVADVALPGSGEALGMAGYFAAGGGAGMAAVGGAMAAVGIAGLVASKLHEETIQLQKDQVAYNDQLAMTARHWNDIGQEVVRTTALGRAARGRATESLSREQSLGEKMTATGLQVLDPNSMTGIGNFSDWAAWAWQSRDTWDSPAEKDASGLNFTGNQAGSDQSAWGREMAMQQAQKDIEHGSRIADESFARAQDQINRRRELADHAREFAQDTQNVGLAISGLGIAGIRNGPAREAAETQQNFDRAELDRTKSRQESLLKNQREFEDAITQTERDRLQARLEATAIADNRQRTIFLQSQKEQIDAQQQVAAQQKAEDDQRVLYHDGAVQLMNAIDRQRAEAQQRLDKEQFGRQQQNELNLARIAGETNPMQKRLDEQKEMNREKLEEMKIEGYSADELEKQKEIGDQQLANLQKELEYEQKMLDIEHDRSAIETQQLRDRTAHMAIDSGLANEQKLLEAQGMTRGAQAVGIQREQNEAKQAWDEARAAWGVLGLDNQRLNAARNPNERREAQDQRNRDQAEYEQAVERAREADQKWQTDKNALQIEHKRSVDDELSNVLDATAVAEGRMSRLQAERRQYERDHPDERSKAELDALDAAKRGQLNADFERSIEDKEIAAGVRRGLLNPMQADYMKLKRDNPDVDDSLLHKMAALDRVGQGDLSTRFTMGQTNFSALAGVVNDNPANRTNQLLSDLIAIQKRIENQQVN